MITIEQRRKLASDIYDQGREAVVDHIVKLELKIESMEDRLQRIEALLNQNSHNSSLPPSSDKFTKFSKNSRPKSKRAPGGQTGHAGSTLTRSATPDVVVIHAVHECTECGRSLKKVTTTEYQSRQVMDIPPINLTVTEHRVENKSCPHCGESTQAAFPASVTKAVQYGVNLKSFAVYLMQYQLLASKRASEAIKDLVGCTISEGSLFNWAIEFSAATDVSYASIKDHVAAAAVIHTDETGIACDTHLEWLHVASTNDATFLAAHPKRGSVAMNAIGILPRFKGTAIHDMWSSYFKFDFKHGICNAHIIRELTFAYEEYKQRWAHKLKRLLLKIHDTVERSRLKGKNSLDVRTLHRYIEQYESLVRNGMKKNPWLRGSPHKRGRKKQSKVRNLLDRLHDFQESVLAFMVDFSVPFTNNLAERDLRMTKVKVKISGCFRSQVGVKIYCRIRSYLSTVRKNGLVAFDAIASAFNHQPFIFKQNYAE